MKKLIVTLTLIALIACALSPAMAAAGGDPFVPRAFVDAMNRSMYGFMAAVYETQDQAKLDELMKPFLLTFTEIEGQAIYYNNDGWTVEVSGYFESGTPDADQSAFSITAANRLEDDVLKRFIAMSVVVTLMNFDDAVGMDLADEIYSAWTGSTMTPHQYDGFVVTAFVYTDGANMIGITRS